MKQVGVGVGCWQTGADEKNPTLRQNRAVVPGKVRTGGDEHGSFYGHSDPGNSWEVHERQVLAAPMSSLRSFLFDTGNRQQAVGVLLLLSR